MRYVISLVVVILSIWALCFISYTEGRKAGIEIGMQETFLRNMEIINAQQLSPRVLNIIDYFLFLDPRLDYEIVKVIAKTVDKYSREYDLEPELVIAVIEKETIKFNPLSISTEKCVGLMQINPEAHPEKVEGYKRYELFHIDTNIKIGCEILKEYITKAPNIEKALKKYSGNAKNYSKYVIKTYKVLKRYREIKNELEVQ